VRALPSPTALPCPRHLLPGEPRPAADRPRVPRPRPAVRPGRARPRPGRVPLCLGRAPPAVLPTRARAPATRVPRVCTARTALNPVLIHFNCCLVDMLRHALHCATNLSNFRFY
jgi:hypothetical protein